MPLNPFIYDTAYFRNIKDRGENIKAADFDVQFNAIASFLNNAVTPVLNQLISDSVPGSTAPQDINKFLRNIGDGNTEWSSIGQDAIADYSLEFTKLSKCTAGTILGSGADKILTPITPNTAGEALISQAGNRPLWRKIRAENIDDRQITAEKIALRTLTNDNFQDGVLATQLLDNSVTAAAVVDRTITSAKIADNSINADLLGDLIGVIAGDGTRGQSVQLYGNTIPDGYFAPVLVNGYYQTDRYYGAFGFEGSVNNTHFIRGTKIPTSKWRDKSIRGYDIADKAIASYQIADNSLAGYRVVQPVLNNYSLVRNINDLIADGSITPAHLTPTTRQALGL